MRRRNEAGISGASLNNCAQSSFERKGNLFCDGYPPNTIFHNDAVFVNKLPGTVEHINIINKALVKYDFLVLSILVTCLMIPCPQHK